MSSPAVAPRRTAIPVRLCRSPRQLAAHHAVRRAVFVDELEMFVGDDRDERDGMASTLHAIGIAGERIAGAVRLYPLRGGSRMVAMIQLPNIAFFESLGWRRDGEVVAFHGRPHQPMAIALIRDEGVRPA